MPQLTARDIMMPFLVADCPMLPGIPAVEADTPVTAIDPADLIYVVEDGKTVGQVTAVGLARGLRQRRQETFWEKGSINEMMRGVFEDALDAIVVVDTSGIIVFLNRAYEVILGIKRQEALGKHVSEILPNSRMHIVALSGIPEIGRTFRVEDKEYIVERHPIFVSGKVVGAVGRVMFRSIGDLKLMVNRLDQLQRQVDFYESQLSRDARAQYTLDDLVGEGEAMTAVKTLARRAARSNATVLILGESGTGKELLAHALHSESRRAMHPFVKVNCAAIPKDLLESELFGYESGAFSGALKGGKRGKFELANKGTIFLDEIADMSLDMQAKVLRALQEREIQKVGGTHDVKVDVRIVAATNKDLLRMVAQGQFRADLYYRLNVLEIEMPPLRDRGEDIPGMVRSLMARVCREAGIEVKALTPGAMAALQTYSWPGNVRELVHTLERVVNIVDADLIDWVDLPPYIRTKGQSAGRVPTSTPSQVGPIRGKLDQTEKELCLEALQVCGGNKVKAAAQLGIHRSVLYRKLKSWGIPN